MKISKKIITIVLTIGLTSLSMYGCESNSPTTAKEDSSNHPTESFNKIQNFLDKTHELIEVNKGMYEKVMYLTEDGMDDTTYSTPLLSLISNSKSIVEDLQVMANDEDVRYDLKMMSYGLDDMAYGIKNGDKVKLSEGFKDYGINSGNMIDDFQKNVIKSSN